MVVCLFQNYWTKISHTFIFDLNFLFMFEFNISPTLLYILQLIILILRSFLNLYRELLHMIKRLCQVRNVSISWTAAWYAFHFLWTICLCKITRSNYTHAWLLLLWLPEYNLLIMSLISLPLCTTKEFNNALTLSQSTAFFIFTECPL